MTTTLAIHPAKCGDAFHIKQKSKSKPPYNIFIDGGRMNVYEDTLGKVVDSMVKKKKENIDLWILTHLDADHLNGVWSFMSEKELAQKGKLLKKIWFNFFDGLAKPSDSDFLSFNTAFKLHKKLKDLKVDIDRKIHADRAELMVGNAKIKIVSPDLLGYQELKERWKKEYKKFYNQEPSSYSSHANLDGKSIHELAKADQPKENWSQEDLVNRTCVAFLYTTDKPKVLFLGDAFPSVIIKELSKDYNEKNRLKVKYVKLSHHGSRQNYNDGLLDIIDCKKFIISSDGFNSHGIPDKEVLAKILKHPKRDLKKDRITFYFSHADGRLLNLFDSEPDAQERYNFKMVFPKKNKPLKIRF